MTEARTSGRPSSALRRVLVPLALAQFICSFAGSNMNVMINDISKDLGTTVQGVQIAITLFLLVMAALMIPGGKLTDRYGRKRCFIAGLVALRHRRPAQCGLSRSGRSHPRQLDLRGRRDGAADPARLHPHDAAVHRAHHPRAGLRSDQRAGRHRRRRRPADRRPDHLRHQLAGSVRVPGPGHRRDPLAEPADRGPAAGGSDAAPSTPLGAVLSAAGLVLVVMGILAADNNIWLMLGLILGGALVLVGSSRGARQGTRRRRAAALRRRCSATAPPTWASSPRTSSG